MKIFTAVFLFSVMLGSKIEVDAGSFNLSGTIDPGFTFGRTHGLRQKHRVRNSDDGNNSDWPQPSHIINFEVPESLIDDRNETGSNDNERPQPPHRRSHYRAHRH